MDFDYPFGILNKSKNGKELFILFDLAVLVIVVR
jgi:hypothetical protein